MLHIELYLFQNYRYLELLCVLCYCDGVAMSDNQNHITNAWLTEGDRVAKTNLFFMFRNMSFTKLLNNSIY